MTVLTPRRSRALLGFIALAAAVTVLVATPGLAQQRDPAALGDDPRNKAFFDEGYCYGHHYPSISPDWMNPGAEASGPAFVVVGEPFTVDLTVFKNWDYDVPSAHGILNLTDAPGVAFVELNATETETIAEGEVPRGGERGATLQDVAQGRRTVPLVTPANPTTLTVRLDATGTLSGTPVADSQAGVDLDLTLVHPDGHVFHANTTGGAPETVDVPHALAVSAAGRAWNATVTYRQGVEPVAPFRITATATHDVNATRFLAERAPPMLGTDLANHTFSWTLVANEPGEIVLDFESKIYAFHKHTPQDEGHTTDDGNITRFDRLVIPVLAEAPPVVAQNQGFALPAAGAVAGVAAVGAVAALRARRRDGA